MNFIFIVSQKKLSARWNKKLNTILVSPHESPSSSFKKVISLKNTVPDYQNQEDENQISFGLNHRRCHFYINLDFHIPNINKQATKTLKKQKTIKSPITGKVIKILK